jgi:anti-sigma regulatory factor (Ser/Thr protein kinase)
MGRGFVMSVTCDPGELAILRREFRAWLEDSGIVGVASDDATLAAHEAAKNAIEHAVPCRSVELRAAFEDSEICLEVTDTGLATWTTAADDGKVHGMSLIHAVATHVEIINRLGGTTLRMRIPVRTAVPTHH